MRRFWLVVGFLLWWASGAFAATITLNWAGVPNATSYVLYQSVDQGATWTKLTEVPAPPATVDVPETGLVLFRVSGKNSVGEGLLADRGAWFNIKWANQPNKLYLQ